PTPARPAFHGPSRAAPPTLSMPEGRPYVRAVLHRAVVFAVGRTARSLEEKIPSTYDLPREPVSGPPDTTNHLKVARFFQRYCQVVGRIYRISARQSNIERFRKSI